MTKDDADPDFDVVDFNTIFDVEDENQETDREKDMDSEDAWFYEHQEPIIKQNDEDTGNTFEFE